MLSGDLGYIKDEKFERLQKDIGDIERMLKGLISSLENKPMTLDLFVCSLNLDPRPLEPLNP